MEFIIIAAVVLFLLLCYGVYKYLKKRKIKPKTEKKEKKIKPKKVKKVKNLKNENVTQLKGAYVDVVDKFLYRKELKVLVLVSKILPKGYVAFPKVGVDTILEPVGRHDLFNLVSHKYLDIVIFDEITMKPKVVIDIFDGSIGDEQLDVSCPYVVKALEMAELPLIQIKVKTDYSSEEFKDPIYKALGIETSKEEENKK